MNRLLLPLATFALTISLGSGAAFANPHHSGAMSGHANGSMMSGHMKSSSIHHRNHKYGNDKARCRDSKGRFLKLTNGRCLAK